MASLNPGRSEAGDDLPIDFEHLQSFTLGNRNLEREVLTLFRDQSRLCIDRLRSAADDKSWKEAAHTLKGSASGIGAWAVRDATEKAERLAGPARIVDGTAAITAVESAVDETDVFIAQFLNE